MALKRDYQEGTKFSYVKVENVSFKKESEVLFRLSFYEKDSVDLEYIRTLSDMDINVQSTDSAFSTYFTLAALDQVDTNIVAQCYGYVKANVDQFRDFVNC